MLVLHLVIALVITLFLVIRFKLSPVFGLILGALYYGIATGTGALKTASLIGEGFGATMRGIGLVVGFGVIIGQLLADSGAVNSIVRTMLRIFPQKRSPEALCATSLVVSTPVFFDVGFIILTPIAKRLGKVIKENLPIVIAPLVIGLGTAHMLIPPTPGPLVVADTLGVPLGQMILGGFIVGIPAAFLALFIYKIIARRAGFWKPDDEEELPLEKQVPAAEIAAQETAAAEAAGRGPSFGLSILPVLVPVILIVLASLVPLILGPEPGPFGNLLRFIGDRTIALLIGALLALLVASAAMDRKNLPVSVEKALTSAGVVLLITGAGGSLGAVLGASNIGKVLAEGMISYHIPAVLLAWIIASVIKIAQGSGTIAIITTANLMAPVAAQLNIPGIWLALAIGSGALFGCHVNDSGFWVVSKIAGLTTKGGFKIYSLATAINAITTLIFIAIFMLFLFK